VELVDWLVIGHVVVFAAWFGTDLATFYLSGRVLDPALDLPVRGAVASAMMGVEVIARLCLPTMGALGISLAVERGYLDVTRGVLIPLWVVTALWVGMVWTIHRSARAGAHGELASTLALVDLSVRSVVAITLWTLGLMTVLAADGGPFSVDWMGAKVLLYALIITSGIVIRFLLQPFGPAFGALMAGEEPERNEAAMNRSLNRARPFVLVIWASLLSAAALGVLGRFPWS
jgi:hypothetical protein